MSKRIRILQFGLGPIGCALARLALDRAGLEIVGAVDIAPDMQGRDLGEVLGIERHLDVAVQANATQALVATRPDVVLHATGSHLPVVQSQLLESIRAGAHVVSTCEEFAYPFYRHPRLADELNAAAESAHVAVLGTGVNPGFVMDKLVATLLGVCQEVEHVAVTRVVDAARRRGPLQRKVGAGMDAAEFRALADAGKIGHVGLCESAHLLADVLALPATRQVSEVIEPKMAEREVRTEFVQVLPGQVAGVDQTATVAVDGRERIRLHLQMYVGAERPLDAIRVQGKPPLDVDVTTGVHGDLATAAIAVNCASLVGGLRPGLRTMLDVPLRIVP